MSMWHDLFWGSSTGGPVAGPPPTSYTALGLGGGGSGNLPNGSWPNTYDGWIAVTAGNTGNLQQSILQVPCDVWGPVRPIVIGKFHERGITLFAEEVDLILLYMKKYGRTVEEEIEEWFHFLARRRIIEGNG